MSEKWLDAMRDESRRERAVAAARARMGDAREEMRLSCGCLVVVAALTSDLVDTLEFGPRCGSRRPCPRCSATGTATACTVCVECGFIL